MTIEYRLMNPEEIEQLFDLWVREMNDSAGMAQRIGNVSHVATHPEARRRGHAKQLLGLVIEKLEEEHCHFSTLFTNEEARPLYENLSWRTCPLPFWQGSLTSIDLPQSHTYSTRSSHPRKELHLWEVLSE